MPSLSMIDLLYKRNYEIKKKRRLIRILIGVGVGGSVFFVAFFLLWRIGFWGSSPQIKQENMAINIEELPLIKASSEPYKVYPKDPGGIQILHQDKEVYQRVKSSKNKQETLIDQSQEAMFLPSPEIPLELEEDNEAWKNTFESLLNKGIEDPETLEKGPASSQSLEKTGQIYYLQVGDLGSREEVYQEWRRLSLHHGENLKDVSLSIIPVPHTEASNEGGFQLFLGRFMNKESAASFCNMLQKEGIPCKMFYKEGNA